MSDRTARLAMLLGVTPVVAGIIIACLSAGAALQPIVMNLARVLQGQVDQLALLLATVTVVGATLLIWRRHIPWTKRRTSITTGLAGLAVCQVLLWQPVWNVSG